MEVLYQESDVKISQDKFKANPRFFDNWGEEFVISFDFYAFKHPPAVTNILHIYDNGVFYYDEYEPQDDYGAKIPGYKTIQP